MDSGSRNVARRAECSHTLPARLIVQIQTSQVNSITSFALARSERKKAPVRVARTGAGRVIPDAELREEDAQESRDIQAVDIGVTINVAVTDRRGRTEEGIRKAGDVLIVRHAIAVEIA